MPVIIFPFSLLTKQVQYFKALVSLNQLKRFWTLYLQCNFPVNSLQVTHILITGSSRFSRSVFDNTFWVEILQFLNSTLQKKYCDNLDRPLQPSWGFRLFCITYPSWAADYRVSWTEGGCLFNELCKHFTHCYLDWVSRFLLVRLGSVRILTKFERHLIYCFLFLHYGHIFAEGDIYCEEVARCSSCSH